MERILPRSSKGSRPGVVEGECGAASCREEVAGILCGVVALQGYVGERDRGDGVSAVGGGQRYVGVPLGSAGESECSYPLARLPDVGGGAGNCDSLVGGGVSGVAGGVVDAVVPSAWCHKELGHAFGNCIVDSEAEFGNGTVERDSLRGGSA